MGLEMGIKMGIEGENDNVTNMGYDFLGIYSET